jgi:hypothetical protein
MTRRLALWLALRTIEVVAILVPAAARSDWKREWHGELRYRSGQLQRRRTGDWRANMDLLGKALGAFPDAAWIASSRSMPTLVTTPRTAPGCC